MEHDPAEADAGRPQALQEFENAENGESLNSDPRLLPKRLRARDVQLEKVQSK